jgi:hypothetical protein
MPTYSGPEWTDAEIEMLRTSTIDEVIEETGYNRNRVADARKRLGVSPGLLSTEDARKAYVLYQSTDVTYDELGTRFGVNYNTIGRIVRGDTYTDLDREHLDAVAERIASTMGEEGGSDVESFLDSAHA